MTWKEALAEKMPPAWAEEIDVFEGQIELRQQGKVDEKVFAETRLRRGAYGQRYDNGQRNDGIKIQKLKFPTDLTKGPDTEWDAPGMKRIKVPYGGLSPEQLEVIADLAEEYSDSIYMLLLVKIFSFTIFILKIPLTLCVALQQWV